MIFYLCICIIFLGAFLVVKKRRDENHKQNLPPGPWGLPLLGHLVFLGRNPHLTLMKWKQKYGPIISCRFGSVPTVVLCDSKVIKEAFHMAEFAGRHQLAIFEQTHITKGIGLSEGPYNTKLRQFSLRKLKDFGVGRRTLENQIHEGIAEFMDFVKRREGLRVESEDIPSAHIIRTLWSITMTDEMNPEQAETLNQSIQKISTLGPVLSELANFMPWMETLYRILSLGRCSILSYRVDGIKEINSFFQKMVDQKKENGPKFQSQQSADIMDSFLETVEETADESSPFHASHNSAPHFLNDMFVGGIHTTHSVLLWMLNYAARNPDVISKLQEEIDQVVGNSRLSSLSDRGQMPYADAFVFELLRKSSIVPLAVPHKVTKDVRFHGYTIKKDTMIFANHYGAMHDPEIFGDPENFRPQRWLGEQGKKLKSDHFLPFSTGRRNCVGEALARDQLFLYVTTLFQRYNVHFYGRGCEVKGVFGIFLVPSEFAVVFHHRKSNE